ncbi:hypothetical protein DMUE_0373 [Dictyocoela muelleri]|nr:hypothetical protein DMUE_0373 [Dictyocoela muelleri]
MRFLSENDAILNLKERFVNIDGIEYKISQRTHTNNLFDTEIVNKTKIFAVKDDIKNLIDKAKAINPILGHIRLLKHHIYLNSPFIQRRKDFTFPSQYSPKLENTSQL